MIAHRESLRQAPQTSMGNAVPPRFPLRSRRKVRTTVRWFLVSVGVAATTSCGGSTHVSGSADGGGSEVGVGPEASAVADGRETDSETDSETSVVASLDGAACFINTSNYDQSCSVDSDCVTQVDLNPSKLDDYWKVQSGNYCKTMCICGGDTISKSAVAQYTADVSKTPLGSGEIPYVPCSCAVGLPHCCQHGLCALCGSVDAGASGGPLDAGTSGAQDAEPPGSVLCGLNTGPLDAGASAGGPSRWCTPPETCVPFNGGWACCTEQGTGGISVCVAPIGDSG
jgi:hypothetical protein